MRDEAVCKKLIDQSLDKFNRLDILVNNAAFQETQDNIEEFSTEMFDRVFKTNVYATFWTCREAIPKMTPGGCIINTCSIQGYTLPRTTALRNKQVCPDRLYQGLAPLAMKHGIESMELLRPVWTPLIPSTVDMEKTRHFGENTLFERPAQPAELAHLYVWLASPQASYVTAEIFGATVVVLQCDSYLGHLIMATWTKKDRRQYEHIKSSQLDRGEEEDNAEEIAARTVNKNRRKQGRTPNTRTQGTGNPNRPLEDRTVDELAI